MPFSERSPHFGSNADDEKKKVPKGPKDDMDKAAGDPNKQSDRSGSNDRPRPVGRPEPVEDPSKGNRGR